MTWTAAEVAPLLRYGFDAACQAEFCRRAPLASQNAVTGALSPLPDEQRVQFPGLESTRRRALAERGWAALRAGRVGVVVLAGGMATRFGGVVKAVVPVLGDRSFLMLKAEDVARVGAMACRAVPTYVMSSFATHDVIEAHVESRRLTGITEIFPQRVALRLTPEGAVFRDRAGRVSPYATGHGDLVDALRASGALTRFRHAGGTTLFMTNVDNLGATLDPAMVGLHEELGNAITVEVVRKWAGDTGGAPALLGGVPQIVEGFRFPDAFDQRRIGVFNTNTLTFDALAIDRDFELPYYRVEKKVDGEPVIQFERLVGELTAMLPSRFVKVDREGADCRFIAVKEPADLVRQQAAIAAVTGGRLAAIIPA